MARHKRKLSDAYRIQAPMPMRFGHDDATALWDYLETLTRHEWDDGEHELCAAVLLESVKVLRGGAGIYGSVSRAETSRRKDKAAKEARAWFLSDNSESVFGFVNVCEVLKIDAGWLRSRILAMEAKK